MSVSNFLRFSLFSMLVSCSQIPFGSKESVPLANKGVFIDPQAELGIRGNELNEMVANAKKSGGKAAEYLATDLFIKGNDASVHGDFKTARQLFQYVVELIPDDLYLKKKWAFEMIRNGEVKEAEGILEDIFKTSQMKDETVGLVLAGVYTTLEKDKEAIQVYQKLLVINPSSEEACLYLARSYSGEKRYQKAHALLDSCNKKSEGNPAFLFFRGKIEYDRGLKEEAKKFFEKALKLDPEYGQAALAIGALLEEKEDFQAAIQVYKNFLEDKDNTTNKEVLGRLVAVMFSQEKNIEVTPYAEALIALDDTDLNLKVRLGLLYTNLERYSEAVNLFKEVLKVVPDSDKVLYYLAALHQQVNRPLEAIEYFDKIGESSPLYGDAGLQIGQILSARGREDFLQGKKEFIAKFNNFIEERAKKNPEMLMELKMLQATFHEDIFQYKNAIDILLSVKSNKNFSESHNYYLASIFEKDGQYLQARSLVEKIVDKDPNNANALNFLGYSYLEKNEKMDKAYEYISKAMKLQPNDGYIRDSMAWYFYQTGNFQNALAEAKKALELVNDDPTITKHLGMIYQRLHHYDKAKIYLTEALKNAQLQSERDDVLKQLDEIENARMPAAMSP